MTTRISLPSGSIRTAEQMQEELLDMNLSEVDNIKVRTANILGKGGILTIGDILQENRRDLLDLKNFGKKSLIEVLAALKSLGLEAKKKKPR